jgi:hypothetical protein
MTTELRLLLIRTGQLEEVKSFYQQVGLVFEAHRHQGGHLHYAAQLGATTFEIYPLLKSQTEADTSNRLGFTIDNFEVFLQSLKREFIVTAPQLTEWGEMAVVKDPDGRKVEIYKKE